MRMMKLAILNFKSSFKNYLSLVISLAFTILIFLNFQNIIYSDAFTVLGSRNKEYIDIIIQVISIVLGCFMFFFIWYSTNVFLTKRKKEIGIYVFMGLTNQKIGKLYMIETTMIGLVALVIGVVFGILTTGLFQMILLAISDIAVDIQFHIVLRPILITAGMYLIIYLIFVLKGYADIVRSSVLNMISAMRQNEYVRQKQGVLLVKAVLGILILGAGYFLAVKDGGMEVMGNVLAAVVLVIIGVYLLFGGMIPFVFQNLAKNKRFLYRKQRNLWVNNVIFRMKKNYRTYAIVCVLVLCSVTALATGFAMKYRYDNIMRFENTYTFQLMSRRADLDEPARALIKESNVIVCSSQIPILGLDSSVVDANENFGTYGVLSYENLKALAEEMNLEFDLPKPKEDEIVAVTHLPLLSLITESSGDVTINGKAYRKIEETSIPYLGYLQEQWSFYMVNEAEYEKLRPLGEEMYTYNYRVGNFENFAVTRSALDTLVSKEEGTYTGRIAIDPNNTDKDWIKVLYSICIFMFLVFVLASGSIMFMKLYNDAFEEKERYLVLQKMGYDGNILKKSIACELGMAYGIPFLVMSISSYFSIHALGKMMSASLLSINVTSVLVVLVLFIFCYVLSVSVYLRNAGIKG